MAGRAVRPQREAARHLLSCRHRHVSNTAAPHHAPAAFSERELALDFRPMLLDHVVDPDAGRALFAGFGKKDDIARERNTLPLQ
jgi:hypothetical protein